MVESERLEGENQVMTLDIKKIKKKSCDIIF